jgi:hypothetical protein
MLPVAACLNVELGANVEIDEVKRDIAPNDAG